MSDRTPPHDTNAERALIGAVLLDPSHLINNPDVAPVTPDDFYQPRAAEAWAAICAVETPDPVIVAHHLGGGDWHAWLIDCEDLVATSANAGAYAQVVARLARHRHVIATLTAALDAAWADPDAAVDHARTLLPVASMIHRSAA